MAVIGYVFVGIGIVFCLICFNSAIFYVICCCCCCSCYKVVEVVIYFFFKLSGGSSKKRPIQRRRARRRDRELVDQSSMKSGNGQLNNVNENDASGDDESSSVVDSVLDSFENAIPESENADLTPSKRKSSKSDLARKSGDEIVGSHSSIGESEIPGHDRPIGSEISDLPPKEVPEDVVIEVDTPSQLEANNSASNVDNNTSSQSIASKDSHEESVAKSNVSSSQVKSENKDYVSPRDRVKPFHSLRTSNLKIETEQRKTILNRRVLKPGKRGGGDQRPFSVAFMGGSPIRRLGSPTKIVGDTIFKKLKKRKSADFEEEFKRIPTKKLFEDEQKSEQEDEEEDGLGVPTSDTRSRKYSFSRPIVLKKKSPAAMVAEQAARARARPMSMRFQALGRKFASPFLKKDIEEKIEEVDDLHERKVEDFFKKGSSGDNISGKEKRLSWQPHKVVLGGASKEEAGPGQRYGGRAQTSSNTSSSSTSRNKGIQSIPFGEIRMDDKLRETENTVVRLCQYQSKYYCVKGVRYLKKFRKSSSEEEVDEFLDNSEDRLPSITYFKYRGIVSILGISEHEDWLYIVMENMKNGDLKSYLSHVDNELRFQELVRILKSVAETISFLHDVKRYIVETLETDSIMLGPNPVWTNVKLSIYKLPNLYRKLLSKSEDGFGGTSTKSHYRAPEIVLAKGSSYQSDVFSFGIVMYEVLTQNFDPFGVVDDDNDSMALKMALNPDFRPSIDNSMFDRDKQWFINLMRKCWKADPSERPSFRDIKNEFTKTTKKLVFSAAVESLD